MPEDAQQCGTNSPGTQQWEHVAHQTLLVREMQHHLPQRTPLPKLVAHLHPVFLHQIHLYKNATLRHIYESAERTP